MGSPTYGTDKTADAQLTSDITGMLSSGPQAARADRLQAAAGAGEARPGHKKRRCRRRRNRSRHVQPAMARIARAGARPLAGRSDRQSGRSELSVADRAGRRRWPSDRAIRRSRTTVARIPASMPARTCSATREEFKGASPRPSRAARHTRKYLSEPPLEYRAGGGNRAGRAISARTSGKKERRAKRAGRKGRLVDPAAHTRPVRPGRTRRLYRRSLKKSLSSAAALFSAMPG